MKRKTKRKSKTARAFFILIILVLFGIAISQFIIKSLYPQNYSEYVEMYSDEYGIKENLVYSIIKAESGFNSNAVSPRGAKGLMQIMDATGEWAAEKINIDNFSTDMLLEPQTNIRIGCWYIAKLIKQYNQNVELALAAYNAGSGNVSKWLKDKEISSDGKTLDRIPFEETQNYVKRVTKYEKIYNRLNEN